MQPMVQFPEQEQLKCPRCESSNTKFCYYNNYSLSQPRYFCKSCRRYWTKGGTLRNNSSSNPPANIIDATSPSGPNRGNTDQTPDLARPARKAAVDEGPSGSGDDLTQPDLAIPTPGSATNSFH